LELIFRLAPDLKISKFPQSGNMKNLITLLLFPFLGQAIQPATDVRTCAASVLIRTTNSLSSGKAQTGQQWQGVLEADLYAGGSRIAKRGATVQGTIVEVSQSPSLLRLQLTRLDGQSVEAADYEQAGVEKDRGTGRKITGWAITGALVGGVLSGGKGAAAGAAAGTAVGAARAAGRRYEAAEIPAESLLRFEVKSPSLCAAN